MNITIEIVLILLGALALIVFFIVRNRKDRKEVMPPEATDDPVEEARRSQDRDRV